MVAVSDRPPGANRLVLAPVDENPVEEIDEERSDPVTFKYQHHPHALEHVVPPTVSIVPASQQHQREKGGHSF